MRGGWALAEKCFDCLSYLSICAKAFWPPKSPETTPNPKFSRKSGVAPKSPRNSHWIHTKRHTKPHWIPLGCPEFSRNFTNFPEFAQIPPNPWHFLKIRGGEEFTQSASLIYLSLSLLWKLVQALESCRTFCCQIDVPLATNTPQAVPEPSEPSIFHRDSHSNLARGFSIQFTPWRR